VRRTPRGGSGTGHGHIAPAELLKLQKSGQFPDEFVKIEDTQIHYVSSRRNSNSRHKADSVRGIVIIVRAMFSNFVTGRLIK
jgi:hypothetical protein